LLQPATLIKRTQCIHGVRDFFRLYTPTRRIAHNTTTSHADHVGCGLGCYTTAHSLLQLLCLHSLTLLLDARGECGRHFLLGRLHHLAFELVLHGAGLRLHLHLQTTLRSFLVLLQFLQGEQVQQILVHGVTLLEPLRVRSKHISAGVYEGVDACHVCDLLAEVGVNDGRSRCRSTSTATQTLQFFK
jgi:hypothetical protein